MNAATVPASAGVVNAAHRAFSHDRDAFLQKLHEWAASLFTQGYSVRPHYETYRAAAIPFTFDVINPQGGVYVLNVFSQHCNCDFGRSGLPVACKHLVGIRGLIEAQCDALHQVGYQLDREGQSHQAFLYHNRARLLFRHWYHAGEAIRKAGRCGQ